jgi:hydroxyacylglutathione hydrolase
MIGFDQIAGIFPTSALQVWAENHTLQLVPQMDAPTLAQRDGSVTVVDVRGRSEWDAGHLPGAVHIPLATLANRLDELPRDTPVVMQCQSGGRSSIASALLQAHGFENVVNLRGGFRGWREAGLPVEAGDEVLKS